MSKYEIIEYTIFLVENIDLFLNCKKQKNKKIIQTKIYTKAAVF
jgi:hypothetical protein